jgi:hypothetical protein
MEATEQFIGRGVFFLRADLARLLDEKPRLFFVVRLYAKSGREGYFTTVGQWSSQSDF